MSTIQRVLFPIDFSLACQALAPTVRRMIEFWHVEVTLLHVIEDRQWLARKHELERLLVEMRTIAGERLGSSQIRCRLERGDAAGRILEHVRTDHIDLVVIPAGGSSSLYGSPLGAVADLVLADAPCPVWLDWGSARSRATSGMYARRVCCALALNESDESVLGEAAGITAALGADLTLIHALWPKPGKPVVLLWDETARDRELAFARQRIDGLRSRFSPSAEVSLEIGSSHTVVSRTIQSYDTGLLVTGNWREAILAAESECPVLRLPTPTSAGAYLAEPQPRYATAGRRSA